MTRSKATSEEVLEAIALRRSVRGFLPDPVSRPIVVKLLETAARAPSGNNIQPWNVHVLTGTSKKALTDAIMVHRQSGEPEPAMEYGYYPQEWPQPYLDRRREVGWALYSRLGIEKGDRAAARAWHDCNFDFFGAPVGIIITIDRRLGLGAFLDVGMFLQGIAIGCASFGLETCMQAAFGAYHEIVRSNLSLPAEQMVICGLALGYENPEAPANDLRTSRVPVEAFATFRS